MMNGDNLCGTTIQFRTAMETRRVKVAGHQRFEAVSSPRLAPPLAGALRREVLIKSLLGVAALIASISVLLIFAFLVYFTLPLFQGGQLAQGLSWHWRPFQGQFGILPMIVGSIGLASFAMILAFPLGLGLSGFVYLHGHKLIGRLVLAVVQFMTSIPTVVYGFVAVFLLIPFLRTSFSGGTGFSWLAATLHP